MATAQGAVAVEGGELTEQLTGASEQHDMAVDQRLVREITGERGLADAKYGCQADLVITRDQGEVTANSENELRAPTIGGTAASAAAWPESPPRTIVLATDLNSRCDRAMDRTAQLESTWQARLIVLNVLEREEFSAQRR